MNARSSFLGGGGHHCMTQFPMLDINFPISHKPLASHILQDRPLRARPQRPTYLTQIFFLTTSAAGSNFFIQLVTKISSRNYLFLGQ